MTREPATEKCPKCKGMRHKIHTLEKDIAVCDLCGHREKIEYKGD